MFSNEPVFRQSKSLIKDDVDFIKSLCDLNIIDPDDKTFKVPMISIKLIQHSLYFRSLLSGRWQKNENKEYMSPCSIKDNKGWCAIYDYLLNDNFSVHPKVLKDVMIIVDSWLLTTIRNKIERLLIEMPINDFFEIDIQWLMSAQFFPDIVFHKVLASGKLPVFYHPTPFYAICAFVNSRIPLFDNQWLYHSSLWYDGQKQVPFIQIKKGESVFNEITCVFPRGILFNIHNIVKQMTDYRKLFYIDTNGRTLPILSLPLSSEVFAKGFVVVGTGTNNDDLFAFKGDIKFDI